MYDRDVRAQLIELAGIAHAQLTALGLLADALRDLTKTVTKLAARDAKRPFGTFGSPLYVLGKTTQEGDERGESHPV